MSQSTQKSSLVHTGSPELEESLKVLSAKAQNAQEWWGRRNLWLKVMESCSHLIKSIKTKL